MQQGEFVRICQNSDKFVLINEDWFKVIIQHEDRINRFLSGLLQDSIIIDKNLYDHLRIPSSKPGILHGLPKVHKDGLPLRPILSSIGTCGYGLAKYLVPHLEPLTHNEFTVKDSFSFSDEITKFDSADQLIMASFDIKSVFTNIPLDETIDICANSMYVNNKTFFSFPIDKLKKKILASSERCTFHF